MFLAASEAGDVWAALEDGRVCRVDPVSLELREIACLDAAVIWLGVPPGTGPECRQVVAVTCHVLVGAENPKERHEVWVLPHGPHHVVQTFSFTHRWLEHPITYFVDSRLRLWMSVFNCGPGYDGACGGMDLSTGEAVPIPGGGRGVRGFMECRDGRALAYGGNFGLSSIGSLLARVDRGWWIPVREFSVPLGVSSRNGVTVILSGTPVTVYLHFPQRVPRLPRTVVGRGPHALPLHGRRADLPAIGRLPSPPVPGCRPGPARWADPGRRRPDRV